MTFYGDDFRAHTSCISEAEKYEGALYRPPKGKAADGKPKKRSAQGDRALSPSLLFTSTCTSMPMCAM